MSFPSTNSLEDNCNVWTTDNRTKPPDSGGALAGKKTRYSVSVPFLGRSPCRQTPMCASGPQNLRWQTSCFWPKEAEDRVQHNCSNWKVRGKGQEKEPEKGKSNTGA